MKLELARAMLQNADILLLDEPTNHLDVSNVKWLERTCCCSTCVPALQSAAKVTSLYIQINNIVISSSP